MKFQHPAIARAALLQAKFTAHAPQILQPAAPVAKALPAAPSIAQLEARADDLRQSIGRYEAQMKDPTLNCELGWADRCEALIDEAEDEIAAIEEELYLLEMPDQAPPAADDVDDSDFGRYGGHDD